MEGRSGREGDANSPPARRRRAPVAGSIDPTPPKSKRPYNDLLVSNELRDRASSIERALRHSDIPPARFFLVTRRCVRLPHVLKLSTSPSVSSILVGGWEWE